MRSARYYLARILHECASNLAKLVVRQGFQRLLKKYDSPPSYRLASPHLFWHVRRAHAPSTRATAMIAVATTRLTRQTTVILCTDVLMPRRQESRAAISPTRATCGLAKCDADSDRFQISRDGGIFLVGHPTNGYYRSVR